MKELFVVNVILKLWLGILMGNIIERISFETSYLKTTMLQVIDYFKKKICWLGVISFVLIISDKKSETYIIIIPKRGWINFNIISV